MYLHIETKYFHILKTRTINKTKKIMRKRKKSKLKEGTILDEKYKTHKNFINMGPVRRLKKSPPSYVSYIKLNRESADNIADQICEATRNIAKNCPIVQEIFNPIAAYRFYLALIYIFDPIEIDKVYEIAKQLCVGNMNVEPIAGLVITRLIADSLVIASPRGLSTSITAKNFLVKQNQTQKKASETASFLIQMRTRSLNLTLR